MGITSMIERLEELVLECYHAQKLLPACHGLDKLWKWNVGVFVYVCNE
jgi:hypothetical protein